jgi:hypothetical protein
MELGHRLPHRVFAKAVLTLHPPRFVASLTVRGAPPIIRGLTQSRTLASSRREEFKANFHHTFAVD